LGVVVKGSASTLEGMAAEALTSTPGKEKWLWEKEEEGILKNISTRGFQCMVMNLADGGATKPAALRHRAH
jgi:hypothetical protein